jgi:hypothetical protein
MPSKPNPSGADDEKLLQFITRMASVEPGSAEQSTQDLATPTDMGGRRPRTFARAFDDASPEQTPTRPTVADRILADRIAQMRISLQLLAGSVESGALDMAESDPVVVRAAEAAEDAQARQEARPKPRPLRDPVIEPETDTFKALLREALARRGRWNLGDETG